MWGRWAAAGLVAVLGAAGPAAAQRPRIGVGAAGGVLLGSRLVEHSFAAPVGGEEQRFVQQVDLSEVALTSLRAEWYVTRRITLRGHAAWGRGDLDAVTSRESPGSADVSLFDTGFEDVRIRALDVGLSIWPWAPLSVGFAPFVTVGIGTVRYSFEGVDDDGFFRPSGARHRRAYVVGMGADMEVWRSVMLRMEAVDHIVDSPLHADDFAIFGERRASAGSGTTDRVSSVRLVLGVHVYFPFSSASGLRP